MRRIRRFSALGLGVLLVLALAAPAAVAVRTAAPADMGVLAYSYVEQLAVTSRVAGTDTERAAADTVAGWFSSAGYEPEFQPFVFGSQGKYFSRNVIAYRAGVADPGTSSRPLVIVGAHYDSVAVGKGADDNASGVAAMLEVAARLDDQELPYDIAFIAFGAEEAGLKGSNYYVSRMSDQDLARTIAMINFDSLIAGDYCYIHAGLNEETWARDEMLEIVDEFGLPIVTHESPKYPAGLTPNEFSDYSAFNKVGIPIVAFEATNWDIADLDGYEQTEEFGSFWHTANDDLAIIEELLPGRPMEHLKAYTTLVYVFLRDLEP